MTILAEISDKSSLPEWPLVSGCLIGLCALGLGTLLSLKDRRLVMIPLAAGPVLIWMALLDLGDPTLGPMLVQELGMRYLVGAVVKLGGPYLVLAIALVPVTTRIERRRRVRTGLCGGCGYHLCGIGGVVCPECGTHVAAIN